MSALRAPRWPTSAVGCLGFLRLLRCSATMARRHTLGLGWGVGLLVLGLAAAGSPACSSSTPRDMFYGTDAGSDFDVPIREVGPETTGNGGAGGTSGAGGAGGAAGAADAGGGTDAATTTD